MNAIPRISVIMPVYNAERFLREAVGSILAQTFTDFELIAIDDGSTDTSAEILKEMAAADDRMRIISRPNTGVVGARNDGIGAARGEFLACMDADDIAVSNRFETQVAFLDNHHDCVVVGSWVVIMDEDGNDIYIGETPAEHEQIEEMLLNGRGSLCNPTVIMRKKAVQQVGIYRDQFRMVAIEDMDLFLRLGEVGRFANIREPLLHYRWHLASITHRRNLFETSRLMAVMVKEACQRRGIPERILPELSPQLAEISEKDRKIEHYHRWSVEAAHAGRFAIARKYALAAWRLEPSRKKCWWVLINSLIGVRLTSVLTMCYGRVRFWR